MYHLWMELTHFMGTTIFFVHSVLKLVFSKLYYEDSLYITSASAIIRPLPLWRLILGFLIESKRRQGKIDDGRDYRRQKDSHRNAGRT